VWHSAADAHMREFELSVPADCVASITVEDNRMALEQMKRMLKADTRPSDEMSWTETIRHGATRTGA
jgi:nicotinamidase-related amidase